MPRFYKTSLHFVALEETGEYCQVGGYHSDPHDCRRRVGDERGLLQAREVDDAEHGTQIGHESDGESRRPVEGAH